MGHLFGPHMGHETRYTLQKELRGKGIECVVLRSAQRFSFSFILISSHQGTLRQEGHILTCIAKLPSADMELILCVLFT